MLIREFLCVLEHGLMLFHVSQGSQEGHPDQFLRSNLISALYSFVSQVEGDSIDALRMGKVTLLFQKRSELIFILALDSAIDPSWCETEFQSLLQEFFHQFPEVRWQHASVLDLQTFKPFKIVIKQQLQKLNRRLQLLKLLLDERFITKDEYPHHSLDCLGTIVAGRMLHKYHSQVFQTLSCNLPTLPMVDKLLGGLGGDHVARTDTTYILDCAACALCNTRTECFFQAFLETILTHLGYEIHLTTSLVSSQKYFQLKFVT
ncbi:MAG: hypothetical protein ACFFAE_10785 [Candidatus Hodarchaeota archaeon]